MPAPGREGPRSPPDGTLLLRLRRRLRSGRFEVRDRSMAPTLLPGDRLLVDRSAYRHRTPQRGDLVVLRDPEEEDRLLLKRVVGLPGDLIGRGEDGYRLGPELGGQGGLTYRQLHPHELFVVGDSPAVSRDSRRFGPVDRYRLVGHAWYRYAPADRRGPLVPFPPRG